MSVNEIQVTKLVTKSPWFNIKTFKNTIQSYKKVDFTYESIKNIRSDEYTINTNNNTIVTKNDIFVFYNINMYPVSEESFTRQFLNWSRLFKEYDISIIDSVNKTEGELLNDHKNSINYNFYNNKDESTNVDVYNQSVNYFFGNLSKHMTNNETVICDSLIRVRFNNNEQSKQKILLLEKSVLENLVFQHKRLVAKDLIKITDKMFNKVSRVIQTNETNICVDGDKYYSYLSVTRANYSQVTGNHDTQVRNAGICIRTCLNMKITDKSTTRDIIGRSEVGHNRIADGTDKAKSINEGRQSIDALLAIDILQMQVNRGEIDMGYVRSLVEVSADTQEGLLSNIKQVKEIYANCGLELEICINKQELSMNIINGKIKSEDLFTSDIYQSFFGWILTSNSGNSNYRNIYGLYLGLNNNSHQYIDCLYGISPTTTNTNRHMLLSGQSGGGKTYAIRMLIPQYINRLCQVFVISPKPTTKKTDYGQFVDSLKGKSYRGNEIKINLLKDLIENRNNLDDEKVKPKIDAMISTLSEILSSQDLIISQDQITYAINNFKGNKKEISIVSIIDNIPGITKEDLSKFRLDIGIYYNMFDAKDSIDLNYPLIQFDLSNCTSEVREKMMIALSHVLLIKAFDEPDKPKQLFVDEAHMLTKSHILSEILSMGRSANIGLTLISQEADMIYNLRDRNENKVSKTNIPIQLCFKPDTEKDKAIDYHNWTQDEFAELITLKKGEFIFNYNGTKDKLRFPYIIEMDV